MIRGRSVWRDRSFSGPLALPALWAVSLPAVYVIFDLNILSRYLLPVSPAVIILGVLAAGELAERYNAGRVKVVGVLAALALIQNLIFYFTVVVPPTRAFSEGVREVLIPAGKWLNDNTSESAVIAAPDIGAVGYYSEREILDLGGLVTPWINRMRDSLSVETIITEGHFLRRRCDYLLDRDYERERFRGYTVRGVEFVPVLADTVANLGIRRQNPVVYTLYHLEPLP
jgi:hypothetical protein